MVYGLTRSSTFENWMNLNAAHSITTVANMLIGNKSDLESIRAVSNEGGRSLRRLKVCFSMETSALDSTNEKTAFEMVIRDIYSSMSRKHSTLTLTKRKVQRSFFNLWEL
ncbi:hypothetical protein F2Q70_00028781 [Brassica cretica]|uniref:Uncharacterized protein n=1 Tax=Brassica cretica TaxID=69181 RepID=A0A8S9L7X5_BRACR|nr:hypothetical protein F2Q70_00028781 [Brassica cretica]KAF3582847.1 hypothetical protein DY000_02035889 [Brassica cretica]